MGVGGGDELDPIEPKRPPRRSRLRVASRLSLGALAVLVALYALTALLGTPAVCQRLEAETKLPAGTVTGRALFPGLVSCQAHFRGGMESGSGWSYLFFWYGFGSMELKRGMMYVI